MTDSTRQLAAIMFTDIMGYTAMMRKDEESALKILERNRNLHKPLIEKHGGRFIKEIGDGILATFPTASEAVFCAREIQQELSGDQVHKLRIGIHLGEIVVSEEDIYGDGVNIASRIENIAPAQGIYISESIYNEIRNIPGIKTNFQGEIKFKNADAKIKIYAIALDSLQVPRKGYFKRKKTEIANYEYRRKLKWIAPAIIVILVVILLFSSKFFKIDNPADIFFDEARTVMVLPFENTGGDATDQHIVLGITEGIFNQLVKIKDLKVIDKSYLQEYDYHAKSYREIGDELDVNNLVVGTVNQENNGIKVTAKLINSSTDVVIWTDVYNKPYNEVFSIHNQVALSIADALKAEVTKEEARHMGKKPTLNMTAYDLYLKGREYYSRYTEQDNISAMELFNKAIAQDPDFILPHAGLSDAFSQMAQRSNSKDFWLDSAYHHALIVQQEEPENSSGYKTMGLYYSINGNTSKAIKE